MRKQKEDRYRQLSRQDEDQDRVREQLLDLQRALPVDLEHDVLAVHQALFDRLARRAVEMAMHLRPLEELAPLHFRYLRIRRALRMSCVTATVVTCSRPQTRRMS